MSEELEYQMNQHGYQEPAWGEKDTVKSDMAAFEESMYGTNDDAQEKVQQQFIREEEEGESGPAYIMEQKGYHEPTWGDIPKDEAPEEGEDNVLSLFRDIPGSESNLDPLSLFGNAPQSKPAPIAPQPKPEVEKKPFSPGLRETELYQALFSYLSKHYAEQLGKYKLPAKAATAITDSLYTKITEKMLPNFFEKKEKPVTNAAPQQSASKAKFNFKEMVSRGL